MLKITDLSYRYQSRGSFTLQKINLALADGEMLLLAGRSGCGKSTLIKAISGLLGSDGAGELQGSICLNGEDTTYWPPERIGRLAGTVYQSPDDQLFAMTVADEVGFALENQGQEPEAVKRQVSEALRLVGLAGFEDYSIHKLSGGQRQRLALASILITKPRLLILDEPVSQMNPQGVQSFMQLLVRLNREEGIAILMIEHRVNELCRYFQRLAVMREGRIIYDGSISEAWYALTGRTDVGVREPQSVKLCRALQLPRLTASADAIVQMIERDCAVECSPCVPKQPDAVGTEILQVQDVCYTYPGAQEPTLRGVSFALHEGEINALMGFNGAGKSTLLNLLGGLTVTQRGGVMLKGQNIKKALGQVGYLRQEPDLMLLADTVREELCWKNKTLSPDALEAMLQKLNLTQYADDFPLALSKGQRLRVVLGAMLAKRPALLLLDEPTTGQDEQSLGEIKQLLLDYKNNGGCVLLCTHDVELAAEVADRALVLRQGQLIADSEANSVLSDGQLLQEGGLALSPLLAICSSLKLRLRRCCVMSVRQLWEGTDANGWAQRLNGRTKLAALFLFAVLTITVDNPRTLFGLFTVTLLLHLAAGTSVYKWKVLAVLLLLGLWGSMFSQALFFAQTPRTPLFTLIAPDGSFLGQLTGGLYIYREGILYGAVQGLRSASMLTLGLLVCWTSDPRQLLRALLAWRLSPQLAFMLVTAIRFLPVLAAETGEVITALQLRSDSQSGRTAVLRHLPYIAKPLLARCLRRAQTLALSVVSRGFFLAGTGRQSDVWRWREKFGCCCLLLLTAAVAGSKVLYLLSEQGFYFGVFRKIYDWTILYL